MPNSPKRSLGSLRIQQKTKPKSPEMIGTIKLQRRMLEELIDQIGEDDELVANLAAWKNHDGRDHYLSVEISPRFTKRPSPQPEQEVYTIFDAIDEDAKFRH